MNPKVNKNENNMLNIFIHICIYLLITACGGTYFTNSGVIRSPNYPNYYPTNRDCVWVISVPVGQQILLNITDFDLETYIKCRSDYLEIR